MFKTAAREFSKKVRGRTFGPRESVRSAEGLSVRIRRTFDPRQNDPLVLCPIPIIIVMYAKAGARV